MVTALLSVLLSIRGPQHLIVQPVAALCSCRVYQELMSHSACAGSQFFLCTAKTSWLDGKHGIVPLLPLDVVLRLCALS